MTPQYNFITELQKIGNIEDVIEEYKCKIANADIAYKYYWKECLRLAKEHKKLTQKA
jgi:hypothetical protein